MSYRQWIKILPFFILKKLDTSTNRKNPVWIKFFEGWGYDGNTPAYKEVKADIAVWFPGTYVFNSEMYDLEKKKKEYEKRLQCVNKKLGND
jgi:hypothetical protein